MSGSQDDPLKNDLARDDGRAFEKLYVQFNVRLRLAAWRICRRGDWVDDLTNESWRRAYEARGSFDPSRPFLVWLTGILRNVYREQARSRFRLVSPEAPDELDRLDPAALADEAELLAAIDDCVRRLPAEDRDIVRARFFEGLPLRAVAERSRIPEATLRESRLPAVCDRLRKCLQAKGLENSRLFSAQGGLETQFITESE